CRAGRSFIPPGLKPSSFAQNPRSAGAKGALTQRTGVLPTSELDSRTGAGGVSAPAAASAGLPNTTLFMIVAFCIRTAAQGGVDGEQAANTGRRRNRSRPGADRSASRDTEIREYVLPVRHG